METNKRLFSNFSSDFNGGGNPTNQKRSRLYNAEGSDLSTKAPRLEAFQDTPYQSGNYVQTERLFPKCSWNERPYDVLEHAPNSIKSGIRKRFTSHRPECRFEPTQYNARGYERNTAQDFWPPNTDVQSSHSDYQPDDGLSQPIFEDSQTRPLFNLKRRTSNQSTNIKKAYKWGDIRRQVANNILTGLVDLVKQVMNIFFH